MEKENSVSKINTSLAASKQIIEKVTYEYEMENLRKQYDTVWDLLVEVEEDQKYIPHYIICKFSFDSGFACLEEAYYCCFMQKLDPIIIDLTIEKLKELVDETTFTAIIEINERSCEVSNHVAYGTTFSRVKKSSGRWTEPCLEHENPELCQKIKCQAPDWKHIGAYIMGDL